MSRLQLDDLTVDTDLRGASRHVKVGAPVRFGRYAEIRTRDHVFHLQPSGEIRFVQGRGADWPDPADWLKRTAANDWLYYFSAGYRDYFALFGEYYVPCLPYESNSVLPDDAFASAAIRRALEAPGDLSRRAATMDLDGLPADAAVLLRGVAANGPDGLAAKARRLREIVGDEIPVLPPDARHADYDVLPVVIADGCRCRCRFCRVRSAREFRLRAQGDVERQIGELAELFGADLRNYCACFLGQHDALGAGKDALVSAARIVFDGLGFAESNLESPRIFLFGSVRSLLEADDALFDALERLPAETFVNVGLESADPETLGALGKPLDARDVEAAFERMLRINRTRRRVQVTANFVLGERLPAGHVPALLDLCRRHLDGLDTRGTLYLSPLIDETSGDPAARRRLRFRFREVADAIRLPTHLYLIQRL